MLPAVDRSLDAREVGVPRRLSVAALFVLLTFYGVLFRFLVMIGTSSNWTAITCLFFAAVTVGQMVLFRGNRPRAASIVTGAIICPAILVAAIIDESLTQFTGWRPLASGLDTPAALASALAMLSMIGMLFGYLLGGTLAGVFLVIAKMYPRSVVAQSEPHSAVVGGGDGRTPAFVEVVGRWINPFQPRAPLRGALAALLLPIIFGCCVFPFVPWVLAWQMILFAAGLGTLLAFWTGNLQLSFLWPLALCSVGGLMAAWPAATLLEVSRSKGITGEHLVALRFGSYTLGVVAGLSLSAAAGWIQWLVFRSARERRFGLVPLFGVVVFLVSIGGLAAHRLGAWAQSPRQQLLGKVQADGGTLGWNSLLGGTLSWASLSRKSDDEDFVQLRPLLVNGSAVSLTGRQFTDKSASALNGLHLASLSLIDTSVTDDAFADVHRMSAISVTLNMTDFGDRGLAKLTALPAMPTTLQSLTLNRTQVTDNGLTHLAGCRMLLWLSLAECAITDDGLKNLAAAAPPLQQLILVETDVTDAGLAHLTQMTTLTLLRVGGTKVTRAGVQALQVKLPNCAIIWDDG